MKNWAKLYLQAFWKLKCFSCCFSLGFHCQCISCPQLPDSSSQNTLFRHHPFYHGNHWRFQSEGQALEPSIQGSLNGFSTKFNQMFKKEIVPFLPNLFHKIKEEGVFPKPFQKVPIPKPGKYYKKTSITLMNILNRKEGGRAQSLKERHSQRTWQKLVRTNWVPMGEDSTSNRPWASLYAHCNALVF